MSNPAKKLDLYAVNESGAQENYAGGYVRLYRSIKKHWLWKSSKKKTKLEAWFDLVLRASHSGQKEPFGHDLITLERGQVLTSQDSLSKDWMWDRSAVRLFLSQLEKDQMIALKTTTKYTIITICNYGTYNDVQPSKQQVHNNKTTAAQQQDNTYNNANNSNNANNDNKDLEGGANAPQQKSFKKFSKEDFIEDIKKHKETYPSTMLNDFFKYWSELSPGGKMRFQLQKTWETEKRLATWQRNNQKNSFNHATFKQNSRNQPAVQPTVVDPSENWGR